MNSFFFPQRGLWRIGGALVLLMTINFTAQAQLSGTYKLGGTGANYATFTALATDLNSKGVNGPVTINVTAGTYTERFVLDKVPGTSATNTISIIGAGAASTKITFASTATTNLQTVLLRGTKYVTFKNLTIANTGSTYGTAVHLVPNGAQQAMYNTFDNCTISVSTTSTTSTVTCISMTNSETAPSTTGGSLSASYNTFSNNTISGGYYCIFWAGSSTASYIKGNKFLNNTVTNFYQYGVYSYYTDSLTITGNKVSTTRLSSAYGIMAYYGNNFTITYNVVNTGYACYLYYGNYYGWNGKSQALVANNIFNASTYNYVYYPYYINFYHNTFRGVSSYGSYMYYALGIDVRNNIFSGTTYAMYNYSSSYTALDYNVYYSTGSIIYTVAGAVSNLAAWRALEPQFNEHSLQQDPGFVSTSDAHLNKTGSKPYAAAIFPYNQTDADGDSRCSFAPTIGGDESPLGKNVKPTAGIVGPDTLYVGTPTDFNGNVTAGVPHTNLWYVDDVFVKDSLNMGVKINSTGTHTIKVIAAGCSLSDSVTKTVVVVNPSKKPVADFISSANTIKVGESVAFTDLSINGASSFTWDISPSVTYDGSGNPVPTFTYIAGNANTYNMAARFTVAGRYKICFTTSNSLGSSTSCKVNYVTVVPTYNLTSTNMLSNDSTGYLYDNGGPTGLYQANSSASMLIAPCASEVYLIVKSFEMECGYDYLRVYDGGDNKGTALHPCTTNTGSVGNGPGFTGTTGSTCTYLCRPNLGTDTFKAKSGKMFIEMKTDGSGQYGGFEAYWWSKPKQVDPPVAGFDVTSSTACVDIPYQFVNTSTGESLTYAWDLDGNPSTIESTVQSPSFAYSSSGTYTVTLLAMNCGGMDTFQKDVTVIVPNKPKAAITVDNTNPTTSDIVFFGTNIKECVGQYQWRFTNTNGGIATFVNKTDASSANPQVVFSDTGCYSAFLYVKNSGGEDSVENSCFVRVKSAYCLPSVTTNIGDIGISDVTVISGTKTLLYNHSTQGVDDYQNNAATMSTILETGVAYDVKVGRSSSQNEVTRTIWIDWNLDGDFADAGEKVAEDKKSGSLIWTAHFTVPTSAKTGASIMRIAINQGSLANSACGPNKYGEYEDYRVYISPDITKPVISLIGSDTVYVEEGYAYTDAGATAFDNLSGVLTSSIKKTQQPAFDNTVPGTYLFNFDVQDAAGNQAVRVTRVVIVTPDKTAPDLQVSGSDTIYVAVGDLTFTEPSVTSAMDIVDGDVAGDVIKTGAADINKVGIYSITYTVSDNNKNIAKVTRVIIVQDLVAPVITLLGSNPETHEVGDAYTDAGISYTDNYCATADMAANVAMTSNLDINRPGTYSIVYNLTDCNGNKAVPVTRIVTVQDTRAPQIMLKGDSVITLQVFGTLKDAGVNASDNFGTPVVNITGTYFNTFPDGKSTITGDYTIIYTATDSFGNTSTVTRIIHVVDTQAPVLTLNGIPNANVCRWATYKDEGYTVSDNYNTTADIKVTTEGTFVNTLEDGVYSLRYRAEDKSGNVTFSEWRLVNVLRAGSTGCSTGLDENTGLDKQVNVYPNPSSGKFTIRLGLETHDQVSVRVVNALGQTVSSVGNGSLGASTLQVDLGSQASGVYMLYITVGNRSAVKQVVIAR